ncbi:Lipoma HMGIC fusion partner [Echinococcus granulosus]|uniref:Lipoma HMGIC fusion partner n=1 Tax=Echinococcus granulosus TaxID=6210 RepID=W6UBZ1_ECHGR|nr:Lipoma HMGIC fusion partner [Echinococcus granulosus]EUB58076.1 Lipoma HMGIC fusion partner [Echinococcus granulosus]
MAWISAILCTAGCLFPYWLRGSFKVTIWTPNATTRLLTSHVGLFRRCVYPTYSPSMQSTANDSGIALQSNCGHYSFADIPHFAWKIGLVTLAVSCVILFFITFFLFVSGFSISILANSCVCKLCQFGFLVSGLLVAFTCIMYPIGWKTNEEARQICGASVGAFNIVIHNQSLIDLGLRVRTYGAPFRGLSQSGGSERESNSPDARHLDTMTVGKQHCAEMPNGVYVSGPTVPLLRIENTATPTDQSSLNQGSFSRETSSVQGMVAMTSSTYVSTPEFRVLMPATPVIIQTH